MSVLHNNYLDCTLSAAFGISKSSGDGIHFLRLCSEVEDCGS